MTLSTDLSDSDPAFTRTPRFLCELLLVGSEAWNVRRRLERTRTISRRARLGYSFKEWQRFHPFP